MVDVASRPPSPPPRSASLGSADARWRPGAIVGEYRLVRRLGAGGMGAVDLAEHVETGQQRAIKSLPASADPSLALRFRREAEGMARVDGHPNVARVHSAGTTLGHHYLVLELLQGGDLEQRLRDGPWPADAVARLGVKLARALAHVHARGILHRDLKPANVLFDGPGPDARPALVDFGLARALESRSLTATGELLGTPAFMAPEQALGRQDVIGPRTDVYGLGALLYRALTGHPPARGASMVEVLTQVLHETPRPPSEVVPGVPPALDAALARALAKRPEERFASAGDLALALEAALAPAAPPRPIRAIAALAVAAVALAGVVIAGGLVVARAPAPAVEPAGSAPVDSTAPVAVDVAQIDSHPAPRLRLADIGPPRDVPPEWVPRDSLLRTCGDLALGQTLVAQAKALDPADPAAQARFLRAAELFKAATTASDGAGAAWCELAQLFQHGRCVAVDPVEAAECYERAAKLDHLESMIATADRLLAGWPGRAPEPATARDYYLRASRRPDVGAVDGRRSLIGLAGIALAAPDVLAPADALEVLREVPADDGHACFVRAQLLAVLGRPAEAEAELRAGRADPQWGGPVCDTLISLLVLQGRAREVDEAIADLEARAVAGALSHQVALGTALERRGEVARAAALYEAVAGVNDGWHSNGARSGLARTWRGHVAPQRARELLLQAPDAQALLRLAGLDE